MGTHKANLKSPSKDERKRIDVALGVFEGWLGDTSTGWPPRGLLFMTMATLTRLRAGADTAEKTHLTPNEGQVKSAKPAVRAALDEFSVPGTLSTEAGRTSRGNLKKVKKLLLNLHSQEWESWPLPTREAAATSMIQILCEGLKWHHNQERLDVPIGAAVSSSRLVEMLLEAAQKRPGGGGKAAQHLVGAKLAIRFKGIHTVTEDKTSAADAPTGRPGDFHLGQMSFHVTLAPTSAVVEKCKQNVDQGLRPVLVVPFDRVAVARGLCDDAGLRDVVTVHALGEFVGGNIDEIGNYRNPDTCAALVDVLDEYNRRIIEIESEPSLAVTIPENLR